MSSKPAMPEMEHVCALMPHSKFAGTFVGVDGKTGVGYAIDRCTDQDGRVCFVLRRLQQGAAA